MSGSDEWVRNSRWDENEKKLFYEKLARARAHKAHYLRQKAYALAAYGDPVKIEVAITLVEEAMKDTDRSWEFPNDHKNLAAWHALRNRLDKAVEHYHLALKSQSQTHIAVDFLLFIVRRLPHLKKEARKILEVHKLDFTHGMIRERFVL